MRKIKVSLLSLALLLGFAALAQAQAYIPDPDVYGKIKGAYQPIGLVAKIGYSKARGGYYIRNNPRYGFGDKVILNQNFKVLEKLSRRGKTHTILRPGQPPGIPGRPRVHRSHRRQALPRQPRPLDPGLLSRL